MREREGRLSSIFTRKSKSLLFAPKLAKRKVHRVNTVSAVGCFIYLFSYFQPMCPAQAANRRATADRKETGCVIHAMNIFPAILKSLAVPLEAISAYWITVSTVNASARKCAILGCYLQLGMRLFSSFAIVPWFVRPLHVESKRIWAELSPLRDPCIVSEDSANVLSKH